MARSFDAETFRTILQREGFTIDVWEALQSSAVNPTTGEANSAITDGRDSRNLLYNKIVTAGKCLIPVDLNRQAMDASFGQVATGSVQISIMPDEIRMADNYRVVFTDLQPVEVNYTVIRGAGASDDLRHAFVPSVIKVFDSANPPATPYEAGVDYELTANTDIADKASITWLGGGSAPTLAATYTVQHTYRPIFVALLRGQLLARPDKNGVFLPQVWTLDAEQI